MSVAGILTLAVSAAFGQETSPTPQLTDRSGVMIEEVIVTGSNIPTSVEVGPNPVDTYPDRGHHATQGAHRYRFDSKGARNNGGAINEDVTLSGDGRTEVNLRAFHDFVWENGNVPIALQRWEYLGTPQEND